ncbi:MAG: NAD-dependent epimerase/dehydratase family protein, partial [Chloroflexota bacterium]
MKKVLVIGGAGFIGSHLVDALVDRNLRVSVLDKLDQQVHGTNREPPAYMNPRAQLIIGDVRDRELLMSAMDGAQVVFHLAAAVGVGQSMYEIERYVSANSQGTAVLLDVLANQPHNVQKLIVASSMSIYGEGSYRCLKCGSIEATIRSEAQLQDSLWEPLCSHCHDMLEPIPTPETKSLQPTSIYAITKKDQDEMALCVGKAYGIPTVALRFFNVYGPRQALSNPYTGAAAIFSSRAMNNRPPLVFEDGLQMRDFVHVSDIVQANLIAMDNESANYQVFNVGTGRALSILEIASIICEKLGPPGLKPEVTYRYRKGD